ncbi:MAG: hypothetical protein EXS46_00120 [Candidatus Taylorbacteria bacterium]|nr:hypothetical protein [Candidatus Taylorbacteria bacterium]
MSIKKILLSAGTGIVTFGFSFLAFAQVPVPSPTTIDTPPVSTAITAPTQAQPGQLSPVPYGQPGFGTQPPQNGQQRMPQQGFQNQNGQPMPPRDGLRQEQNNDNQGQNFQGQMQQKSGYRPEQGGGNQGQNFQGQMQQKSGYRPEQGGGNQGQNFQGQRGQAQMQPKSGSDGSYKNEQNGRNNTSVGNEGSDDNWSADEQKRDADHQAREAQMVKKQAAQMVKQLQQQVTSFNKRVAKLKAAGISMSQDCSKTLTTFSGAITELNNVKTSDDLQNIQDDLLSMDDFNQCRNYVEHLIRVPKMMKDISAAVTKLKKKKYDTTELEKIFSDLKSQFDKIKSGNYTNDELDAFFDEADDFGNTMGPLMGKQNDQGAATFDSRLWSTVTGWFGY